MKKTIQRHLLTLLGLLLTIPLFAYDFESDGIYYNILSEEARTVEVTFNDPGSGDYTGDINIPATVNIGEIRYKVISLGEQCFGRCLDLNIINLPRTIESIPYLAIGVTPSLCAINVDPQNLHFSSFEGVLFSNDGEKLIRYPSGKLDNSYSIPTNVTAIDRYAFLCSMNLTEVIIPNSVKTISGSAFLNSPLLNVVRIPESVVSIGENPFSGCDNLEIIDVDIHNQAYKSEKGVLFSKDGTNLVCYPAGKNNESYTIPSSVTTIEASAFILGKFHDIIIPSSIKTIADQAFEACMNLSSVRIPSSVVSIGANAFNGCESLELIEIPASVSSMGWSVFDNCFSLKRIFYNTNSPLGYSASDSFLQSFSWFDEENYLNATLYIPVGSRTAFESTHPWCNFHNIVEDPNLTNIKEINNSLSFEIKECVGGLSISKVPEGMDIYVYTLDGQTVARAVSENDDTFISLPSNSIYVIRIGNESILFRYGF